jgi:hypothetical protein
MKEIFLKNVLVCSLEVIFFINIVKNMPIEETLNIVHLKSIDFWRLLGSFIKFELPEETHMPDTGNNRYFYGIVVRVSFVIDSNSATASTTYTVAHVRTNAEEEDKGFVMTEHPIYTTTWFGGALDAQLK